MPENLLWKLFCKRDPDMVFIDLKKYMITFICGVLENKGRNIRYVDVIKDV